MNRLRNVKIFGLLFFFVAAIILPLGSSLAAASPPVAGLPAMGLKKLAPSSHVTLSGAVVGPVSRLAVMNQSGMQNTPGAYVTYVAQQKAYSGYRRYFLPGTIPRSTVSSMTIKVNYNGPSATTQMWTWYLYDWGKSAWIRVGYNGSTQPNTWKLLTFKVIGPLRFINNTTREIRLRVTSNTTNGNARLDYESVWLNYSLAPTLTPTITRTPTITLTPTATPSSVHFAVIGDYGVDNGDEAAVATLVKSWNPDFIITVGDNNYLYGESATIDQNIGKYYHEFISPYTGSYGAGSPSGNRFFPSLGNHDWGTAGAAPYLAYFTLPGNERYYDFGRGPVRFFAIDSDPSEPDGVTSTSTQATWLQGRLAAATEPWKLVYMHHPPYSSSTGHGSTDWMQWDYQGWGASAVLAGHDHTYERLDVGGLPYFVNGLGGQFKYDFISSPVAGSQVRYATQFGAMLVDATATQITFQFIDIDGIVRDTFTLP